MRMGKSGSLDPNMFFFESIQPFSLQELAPFGYGKPFFIKQDDIWQVNSKHPFFSIHKEAAWAMRIIASEYLLQIQCPPLDCSYCTFGEAELRKNVALRLKGQLEGLLRGIDVDVITAISGERYESKEGKGLSLVLLPFPMSENELRTIGVILLEHNVWFKINLKNVHAIRKQLNLSKNGASLAVCFFEKTNCTMTDICSSSGLYAVGILHESIAYNYPRIEYTGHMEWQLTLPSTVNRNPKCYLRFKMGRFYLPELDMSILDSMRVDATFPKASDSQRDNVKRLLQILRTQTYGGAMIVIAEEAFLCDELDRLCRTMTRGCLLQTSINLLGGLDDLKRLLSVDGAIFTDLDGYCRAYGVLVDGEVLTPANMARGSRFNNADNYFFAQSRILGKPLLVFVRSEDGMVDLFSN